MLLVVVEVVKLGVKVIELGVKVVELIVLALDFIVEGMDLMLKFLIVEVGLVIYLFQVKTFLPLKGQLLIQCINKIPLNNELTFTPLHCLSQILVLQVMLQFIQSLFFYRFLQGQNAGFIAGLIQLKFQSHGVLRVLAFNQHFSQIFYFLLENALFFGSQHVVLGTCVCVAIFQGISQDLVIIIIRLLAQSLRLYFETLFFDSMVIRVFLDALFLDVRVLLGCNFGRKCLFDDIDTDLLLPFRLQKYGFCCILGAGVVGIFEANLEVFLDDVIISHRQDKVYYRQQKVDLIIITIKFIMEGGEGRMNDWKG